MYIWHRARLQPLSSFLSLVMTICFMAILVLLHQSSRPPLQAVYQLSTLKTESVSTFIQNYFILLFLPIKDFIYIRFRRFNHVLHSVFIMWTLSATHSVDVKSQLSLWKMKPWSKPHASFKINWTVYGLWEVLLPVLWVVVLLLLLLCCCCWQRRVRQDGSRISISGSGLGCLLSSGHRAHVLSPPVTGSSLVLST